MKFSIPYQILKQGVKLCREGFYRKISIVGKENLPNNKPYILAPNHQNGFMDPIMVAASIRWKQTFYLVRADIFKNKWASKALHAFNMMPVYRMRDGADSIEKNKEIFEKCHQILKGGNPLMIFPEGNHSNVKKLRPLKKGIARIAFGAEEAHNFDLDIQIVPVGVNYSNHTDVGATLQVAYGKPISILDYKESYLNDSAKTLVEVRQKLYKGISDLIINIQAKNYGLIESIRQIFQAELSEFTFDLDTEIRNSQDFINKHDEAKISEDEDAIMENMAEEIKIKASQLKLRLFAISNSKYPIGNLISWILLLVLSFPFFIYGLINNYFPFHLPNWIVQRTIKDLHFHSSLKMGFALVLFGVFHLVQTFIVYSVFNNAFISIGYLISIILFGLFSLKWFYKWREITQKMKVNRLFNTNSYKELIAKRAELKNRLTLFYKFPST